MKLYLVRHGQTEFNSENKYAGSTDVSLNSTGIKQAEKVSEKLKSINFDIIVTSPMIRARQTAEIIQRNKSDIPFVIVDDMRERCIGVFEGLTRSEAKSKYPRLWAENITRKLDDAPPDGETIRSFNERIFKALSEIKENYAGKTVLLVSHGFVARVLNRIITGLSFDDMHTFILDNCDIAEYII